MHVSPFVHVHSLVAGAGEKRKEEGRCRKKREKKRRRFPLKSFRFVGRTGVQKALLLFRLSATAPAAATTAPSPPPPAAFTPTYIPAYPATPGYGVKKREPGNLNAAASGSALEKLKSLEKKGCTSIASGIPSLFRGSCSFIYLFIRPHPALPPCIIRTHKYIHTLRT